MILVLATYKNRSDDMMIQKKINFCAKDANLKCD